MQVRLDTLSFVPIVTSLLALLALSASLRNVRRRRLIRNLPTSKTTGVFIGAVELKGTAESETPLSSFLAEVSCVVYSWSVEEHWSRTVTETYTDDKGQVQTRTRHESGWSTVADGGEAQPFYLQDDHGLVRVLPEGAKIEPRTVFSESCTPSDTLYYAKGPAGAVADSDHRRRFTESAIPLHAEVYILGQAREREDIVAPEIAADSAAPMFLISCRTEDQIISGMRWGAWGWGIGGLILSSGGFAIVDSVQGKDLGREWPVYVCVGAGFAGSFALAWVVMAYNSLVNLRQRVRQAWSLVDVQLKRRHDLIRNLMRVVSHLRDHERRVQTELARLRNQSEATPPGVDGPDPEAVSKSLLAVAEAYPELKAQDSFLALQRELASTEERIALARGYFNEIATSYNTCLVVVPDRWIGCLAFMKPQPLMEASGFERATVQVRLAT